MSLPNPSPTSPFYILYVKTVHKRAALFVEQESEVSRNGHGNFTRPIGCGILQRTGARDDQDIDTTSNEHRALTLIVRTPQCGHTV